MPCSLFERIQTVSFLIVVLGILPQTLAQGLSDRVRLLRGSDSGEITSMTPFEVTLNKGASGNRVIAVNEIKNVQFHGEPVELAQARMNVSNGQYQDAMKLLDQIDLKAVRRPFLQEEIEFHRAWCMAKLALAGEREIGEAGRQLSSFVRNYPKNFHNLAAIEMMGDLLVAGERFEDAQKQYVKLASAPWPDYKMRAAIAVARTLQAQNKHAEAIQQFDQALAITGEGADLDNQRLTATLGKAISLAETGSVDAAVEMIERVIYDTDPQQKELLAQAYLAQGACFEKAGRTKDALLAYLHVDVLYSTLPDAHAEALAHLVPLWSAIGQEEQARQARALLHDRYRNSRWAKQLK